MHVTQGWKCGLAVYAANEEKCSAAHMRYVTQNGHRNIAKSRGQKVEMKL